eukprot:11890009-Ditylum_brightwellii.AAC.1
MEEEDEMKEVEIPEEEWEKWEEKVTVVRNTAFPYLDIKFYWAKNDLHFALYNKKNQQIKYVNKESCHRASVFKAILVGVFTRLGQLTSKTDESENMLISELYPDHTEVLQNANILLKQKKIPIMKKLYKMEQKQSKPVVTTEYEEQKMDVRKLYFVIGHSYFWQKMCIAQIIRQLKK